MIVLLLKLALVAIPVFLEPDPPAAPPAPAVQCVQVCGPATVDIKLAP